MAAPEFFIKFEYMPEFGMNMYQKYIPVFSDNELVDDGYQEMVWWDIRVCDSLTGDFQEWVWVPMGLPVKGVA